MTAMVSMMMMASTATITPAIGAVLDDPPSLVCESGTLVGRVYEDVLVGYGSLVLDVTEIQAVEVASVGWVGETLLQSAGSELQLTVQHHKSFNNLLSDVAILN